MLFSRVAVLLCMFRTLAKTMRIKISRIINVCFLGRVASKLNEPKMNRPSKKQSNENFELDTFFTWTCRNVNQKWDSEGSSKWNWTSKNLIASEKIAFFGCELYRAILKFRIEAWKIHGRLICDLYFNLNIFNVFNCIIANPLFGLRRPI